MTIQLGQARWKLIRAALVAVCMAAALAGSHATVGRLCAARAAGESGGTPVEELRHDTFALRRESKLLVRIANPMPSYEFPRVQGRLEVKLVFDRAFAFDTDLALSGGQHALRNGLGAPMLA